MAELVYRPVIAASQVMFKVLGLKIRLSGLENVPPTGGVVLASNHISYLDFIFVGLAPWRARKRLTRFMAKEGVFTHRISGPLMRGMKHIPVDRDAGSASMRAALKALKGGEIVGVFPEATISQSFTVKEIKSGAVRMAAAAKAPLLPVAVWGTHRLWTKGHKRSIFRGGRGQTVFIRVGAPIEVGRKDDMEAVNERLRATLQEMLSAIQAEHPSTTDPGPHAWWLPASLGGSAPTPEQAQALDEAEQAERAARRN